MSNEFDPIMTASECAQSYIEDAESYIGATLEECGKLSYSRVLLSLMSGIKMILPDSGSIYYEVTDQTAEAISLASHRQKEALGLAREICAQNVVNGVDVPPQLRHLCFILINDVDCGQKKKSGPAPYKNFAQFYIAVRSVEYIANAYNLPRTRGDDGREDSAAHIVADVFTRRGVKTSPTGIRDWCNSAKYNEARKRAAAISDKFDSDYLVSLGVIKPLEDWIICPDGLLRPIGRMTT